MGLLGLRAHQWQPAREIAAISGAAGQKSFHHTGWGWREPVKVSQPKRSGLYRVPKKPHQQQSKQGMRGGCVKSKHKLFLCSCFQSGLTCRSSFSLDRGAGQAPKLACHLQMASTIFPQGAGVGAWKGAPAPMYHAKCCKEGGPRTSRPSAFPQSFTWAGETSSCPGWASATVCVQLLTADPNPNYADGVQELEGWGDFVFVFLSVR